VVKFLQFFFQPVRFALATACVAVGNLTGAAEAGPNAPVRPAAPVELQKLVEQSNQQRDRMIAEHESLARQLKDATEEKRREIYEKMSEQKKAFEAAQSALHKRIREEQRAQRALQRSR